MNQTVWLISSLPIVLELVWCVPRIDKVSSFHGAKAFDLEGFRQEPMEDRLEKWNIYATLTVSEPLKGCNIHLNDESGELLNCFINCES